MNKQAATNGGFRQTAEEMEIISCLQKKLVNISVPTIEHKGEASFVTIRWYYNGNMVDVRLKVEDITQTPKE